MQAAKFVHKLVSEGLVDREALIIKQAQYQEKATLGLSAAMTSNWWDANAFTDASVVDIPDLEWFTPTKIYVDEATRASRNRPWTDWVGCWSSLIFSKTVPEETLRHLLAVLDYMAGEEGQLLVQAGIEGVTYQWNELGTYEFLPEFIEKTNNLDWNKAAAYGVFYYAQLVNNTPVIFPLQATPPALTRPDNFKSWENQQDRRDAYDKHMEPPLDYYFLPGPVENEKLPAIKDAMWSSGPRWSARRASRKWRTSSMSGAPPPRAWASMMSSPSARPSWPSSRKSAASSKHWIRTTLDAG